MTEGKIQTGKKSRKTNTVGGIFFYTRDRNNIKIKSTPKMYDSRIGKVLNYLLKVSNTFDSTKEGNPSFIFNQSQIEVDRENAIIYMEGKIKKNVIEKLEKIAENDYPCTKTRCIN